MYEAKITATGLRHLDRLPDKVRQAALETIFGASAENPHRAGKPLLVVCLRFGEAARSTHTARPSAVRDGATISTTHH